jgi:hypothetical protein
MPRAEVLENLDTNRQERMIRARVIPTLEQVEHAKSCCKADMYEVKALEWPLHSRLLPGGR